MNDRYEALRSSYKPEMIKVLFVGESRPAGGAFFYSGNSTLSRYTQKAFELVLDKKFSTPVAFLKEFRALGCYLDDLALEPVNNLKNARERTTKLRLYIPNFAQRLQAYGPTAIIVVKRSIVRLVEQGVKQSGISVEHNMFFPLIHPARGHHNRYVEELSSVLRELIQVKLLSHS